MEAAISNSLYFDDLVVGAEYVTQGRTIAEYDLILFAGMTGDASDVHVNAERSENMILPSRPAHGMFLASLANGLFSRLSICNETAVALTGVEWRFRAPALIGDSVKVFYRISEKREVKSPDRGLVFFEGKMLNQRNETIGDGRFGRMVMRRAAAA